MKSTNSNSTYTLKTPTVEIPLDKQVDEIFQRPLSKLPVYKDLPRLANRITIEKYTSQEDDSASLKIPVTPLVEVAVVDHQQSTQSTSQEDIDTRIWNNVKSIIYKLSELYEDQETQDKIKNTFESVSKVPSDYQLSLPLLFQNCMNEETSKVIKILKLIHQNIIYIGCYELKVRIPYLKVNLTKDVRDSNGWRISVFKGSKDTTTIIHTKREEAMDKKFYFEWQLHITLCKDLTEISYASLKITDLVFDQNVTQQFKEEISRELCNGNLFVM